MKRPIENNSSPGQAVYEPFCGSGTTIIAAEITGRLCNAMSFYRNRSMGGRASINIAMPVGLAINELLTNAFNIIPRTR